MANYGTNEFKGGLKIMLDGDPHSIVSNEFVKPGKGQAFARTRVRNLKTGRVVERTFKSGESVESADVMDTSMQYLYSDGEYWHFMNPETFEQLAADKTAVAEAHLWLMDEAVCEVTLYNGQPSGGDATEFCGNGHQGDRSGLAGRYCNRWHQASLYGNWCSGQGAVVYRGRRENQD